MSETSGQKENKRNKIKGEFFMLNTLKKRIKNEKGLTLIELLAVVVILAIIAAIAIPAIGNIIENSRIKAIKSDAANIISAAEIYYTDGNSDEFSLGDDDATGTGYIKLSSTPNDITVDKDGKLNGSLTKGDYTLEFENATLADIEVDSAEETDTVTINP